MLKRLTLLFMAASVASNVFAQVPLTDIYLMDMHLKGKNFTFSNAEKISNWKGYNNQPYFTPDGKSIYYVSYRNNQSDVYRYIIKDKKTDQFTNTPEDEYSPKLTPDGKFISVVRVMKDSAQQLWKFPVSGGEPEQVLYHSDSIGYYYWRKNLILMANIPEPMNLTIKDSAGYEYTGRDEMYFQSKRQTFYIEADKNVGRTLLPVKGQSGDILYVKKHDNNKDSVNYICRLHIIWDRNHHVPDISTSDIIATLPNCEDFAVGPKNQLFMGWQGKLYMYRIGQRKEWKQIADFNEMPFKNFYRIAISDNGDKIAIVAYQGKKP